MTSVSSSGNPGAGIGPGSGAGPEPAMAPRPIGRINWIGVRTLYAKEVRRFFKVMTQTVLAPMVTTLLMLVVFALALGGEVRTMGGIPFLEFLAPGLVMMALAQNAFANSSSSLTSAKIQGNIVDILMPPLGPGELVFGYGMAAVTRGVVVAGAVALAMLPVAPLRVHDAVAIVFFALSGALMLALAGIIGGLWSEKFDHLAAVTNFAVTPLAFLSGTFYSVERLPEPWLTLSHLNPFFYMIDGFRYGFTGRSDSLLMVGAAVLVAINVALWGACHVLIARGWRLKA